MQSFFTNQRLDRRAATIIRSVRAGKVAPNSDALAELAEITEVISDQPVKPIVVARLTIFLRDGKRMIVEVEDGCRFSSFYHFYTQQGARRSTKEHLRAGSRNEGLGQIGYFQPGLESVAAKIEKYSNPANPIVKKTLRIIRCRAYRKLINARPDQLGLTKSPVRMPRTSFCPSGSLVAAR